VDVVVCDVAEFREGCVPWTAEEAGLLYDTLEAELFAMRIAALRYDPWRNQGSH